MNKKKKIQLLILFVIFLIVAAAFGILKLSQKNMPAEEEETEEESFQVLSLEQSLITDIGIINKESSVNLSKNGDDWKCMEDEGFAVDGSLVESFLAEASTINSSTKIEDVEDMTQYGLEDPSVSLTLQWDDNMYTIKLGDYNSMISGYYLNVNDENTVYVVSSSLYYSLNKSLEDFALNS